MFLFDFILFCRNRTNVKKCEKKMKNAGNEDLGRLDSNPSRIARPNILFSPKKRKKIKVKT